MIVRQHKDIDASEAKVMYGLSLKRMSALACGGLAIAVCMIGLHLPGAVACIAGVLTIFLMTYKRQGQIAPILILRWIGSLKSTPYCREAIASWRSRTPKQQRKAALAWNRELRRQKRKHPNAPMVRAVRCSRSKYSRK